MSKKTVTLTRAQAQVLNLIVSEGQAWGTPKAQWHQMKLIEQMNAWPREGETVTLETMSLDRQLIIGALSAPEAATMIRGRGLPVMWEIKRLMGWKDPEAEDMDDDEEEADATDTPAGK